MSDEWYKVYMYSCILLLILIVLDLVLNLVGFEEEKIVGENDINLVLGNTKI